MDSKSQSLFGSSALGLLVGILLGLSASETVGIVIGGLTALLATVLGVTELRGAISKDAVKVAETRRTISSKGMGFFATFCILGIVLGISGRTHNILAKSPEKMLYEWTQIGVNRDKARSLVIYQKLGILPPEFTIHPGKEQIFDTLLFSRITEECSTLGEFLEETSEEEAIRTYSNMGGAWPEYLKIFEEANMSDTEKKNRLDLIRRALCN